MRAPGAGSASMASLVLLWLLGLPWTWSTAAALCVYVGGGGWRFLRIVCKTARRDLFGLSVLIRVRLELWRHQRACHTIPGIFQAVAQQQPDRLALVDAGSGVCWTFAQLDAYSNAVANVFHQLGFSRGDVVAIFLEGRPEFVGLWLGLAKAGVEAALLNVNLRREPLTFCLGTSGAKALIFGGELAAVVAEVSGQLGKSLLKFCSGDLGPEGVWPDTQLLDPLLKEASTAPLAQSPGKGMDDRLFYIYTSGTTGLPKAAIVVHSRYYRIAAFGHHAYSMRAADVLYDCLPLCSAPVPASLSSLLPGLGIPATPICPRLFPLFPPSLLFSSPVLLPGAEQTYPGNFGLFGASICHPLWVLDPEWDLPTSLSAVP
ncbi:solute carrier family 27 member 1 [Phyllostomus discolor]|uniref:Long-chain-fatty-acid--CoA ligase n=1 Tax=Phyllostomus discolor TaxID=89673 RepID=A0A833ZNM4_9CHIR|nr:solute carrier family 27 member 1 [Phyllostomus discolor]